MEPEYDPDETPDHHYQNPSGHHSNLNMSDHQRPPSGHLSHHSNPNMSDHQRPPSGHLSHHPHPNMASLERYPSARSNRSNSKMSDSGRHLMADLQNPSGHYNGPPPPHTGGRPAHYFPPPPAGKPYKHPHPPQYSPPPPHHYSGDRKPSKAGPFAAVATLILLLALTALILYLVYRPKTPHFSVVAVSIYLLNSTAAPPPTASFLAATLQFTVVTRNPHRHTSLNYDHLTAQVFYRDQPITPPANLPPLHHTRRTTVVFSPVLGGGEPVPVAPGVVEGLAADELYGAMELRLALTGRVRYVAGIIKSAHSGVYVGCDLLIGVKKAVVGSVPLLASHDCKVDM